MKNLPRSAMSLVLVAVIFCLTLAKPPSVPLAETAPGESVTETGPVASQGHEDQKVTTLKNDAAKLRVMQLSGKDKALKRALKDFEKIGKHPDWDRSSVSIVEPKSKSATLQTPSVVGSNSFAPGGQTYDDGAGSEMVMVAESGPNDYWSGIIYVHDATTGLDSTYSAVLTGLVMAQLETLDVVDELYYPPDGSSPIREEPPATVDSTPYGGGDPGGGGGGGFINPLQELPVAKNIMKRSPNGTLTNVAFRRGSPRPGIIGWFKRYFRCVKRCTAFILLSCFPIYAAGVGLPHANVVGFLYACLPISAGIASVVCAFNTHACGG